MASIFDILLYNVVAFLAVLTLIVAVHEAGHYLVARWCRGCDADDWGGNTSSQSPNESSHGVRRVDGPRKLPRMPSDETPCETLG